MSFPSTPVKKSYYVEEREKKIHKIMNKNCNEPNRWKHAMRLGICQFKIAAIKEVEQKQENKLIIKVK